ncbi:MAG: universal stress protein [Rhodoferax sp.]|nr:universal stress protein [Rhodoferax sp.]
MKILVCHDGSENAQSALEKCIALLGHLQPQMILVSVVADPLDASSHDEQAFEGLRAAMEAALTQSAQWAAERGFDVSVVLATGDPRKMLVATIEAKQPDLVVIASRPPQGGIRFGNVAVSVSDYLLRHLGDLPVLLLS